VSIKHVQPGQRQSYASNIKVISPVLMWHWGQTRLSIEPLLFGLYLDGLEKHLDALDGDNLP